MILVFVVIDVFVIDYFLFVYDVGLLGMLVLFFVFDVEEYVCMCGFYGRYEDVVGFDLVRDWM